MEGEREEGGEDGGEPACPPPRTGLTPWHPLTATRSFLAVGKVRRTRITSVTRACGTFHRGARGWFLGTAGDRRLATVSREPHGPHHLLRREGDGEVYMHV